MTQETAPAEADPQRRRRLMIYSGGAAAAVVALAGIYGLTHSGDDNQAAASATRAQTVTVMRVEEATFVRRLTLSGQVTPRRDIRVYAPSTGVRVLELLVDEGDYVRQGQPLARLDAALATAQIRAAEASVKEAEVAAMTAKAEAARAESVREVGALSAEAIAARLAQAESANARLAAAQAQFAEVNARLQGGYVRAPASGLVISRQALAGQIVDGQPLFRIAADNALDVAVEVSEADSLLLRPGQRVTFRMVDGSEVQARLRRLPGSIDSETRTGQALYALPGGSKIRAGMFLRGEAPLAPQERLAAPQASVLFDGGDAYVYLIDAENRARRTKVALGARDGELVAIESGLAEGARIAASGAAFLQDGDLVSPVEADAEPAPPAAAEAANVRQGG